MKASIRRNGNTVMSDVDVCISIGAKEWSGSFEAGHHEIGFDDGEYALELADGRSGRILIIGQGIAGGSAKKLVRFQGTGPLE